MFWHLFSYRLRCSVRTKEMMFWSAAFPLVLATLFGLAFSNLNADEPFSRIPIAVVETHAYQSSEAFRTALDADAGDEKLFASTVCGKDKAQGLLEDGSVAGIMTLQEDGGIVVAVKESGIRQSIIKSFADTFLQMSSAYQSVAVQNPMAMQRLIQEESGEAEYLREIPLGASNPDNTVVYYFALIAMACLYGSFLGMDTVTAVQANQSDIAARTTLAPIHKLKVFGASLSASLVLHFASILVLIAYLRLVIGVQFGDRLGYVVLACMAGSVMGVAFGAMISALLKRREGTKIAVLICISMVCSFLAGLMYHDMKYVVEKNVPLLGYLNPANLVADAFYALFYYDTLNRYFLNIGLLFGFAGVFFLVVYFVMRRQKYASL